MWCRCDKVEPGRPTPRRRRVYHFASTTYQSSKRILCPSDVQTKGRHMPPLSPSDATRAKWRHLLEPGWTEVMQALDLVKNACEQRSRYPAPRDGDLDRLLAEFQAKMDEISEAFRKGTHSPSEPIGRQHGSVGDAGRRAECRCGAAATGPSRAQSGRLISPRSRARKSVT